VLFGAGNKIYHQHSHQILVMYVAWEFIFEAIVHFGLVQGNRFSTALSNVRARVLDAGVTVREAGGGGPLPQNGEQWHAAVQQQLKVWNCTSQLPCCSSTCVLLTD
jgi:hypothetical protein